MKPFIIYTYPFSFGIGGVVVLHKLCDLLNSLGQKAYIFPEPFPGHPGGPMQRSPGSPCRVRRRGSRASLPSGPNASGRRCADSSPTPPRRSLPAPASTGSRVQRVMAGRRSRLAVSHGRAVVRRHKSTVASGFTRAWAMD